MDVTQLLDALATVAPEIPVAKQLEGDNVVVTLLHIFLASLFKMKSMEISTRIRGGHWRFSSLSALKEGIEREINNATMRVRSEIKQ